MYINKLANNQFTVTTEKGIYLQSYDSVVAFRPHQGAIEMGRDWEYSRTTIKYVGQFLEQSTAKTRKCLESGKFLYNENLCIK